eukprot:s2755_g2.t1
MWMARIRKNFVGKFYAPSTLATKNTKRKKVLEILGQLSQEPFPLTVDCIVALASLLDSTGMKAGDQYLAEAKAMHVEAGHEWSLQMDMQLATCKRAMQRDKGPEVRAKEVKIEDISREAWDSVGDGSKEPKRATWSYAWALLWMLRAIEAANLRAKDVVIKLESKLVKLHIRKSKTDQKGIGTWRTLKCCQMPECEMACPFRLAIAALNDLKSDDGNGPLFPEEGGGLVSKVNMVKSWAKYVDGGISGHSARRSGAMHYARRNLALQSIQFLGRWRSSAVFRYVEEALTELPMNVPASGDRGAAGLEADRSKTERRALRPKSKASSIQATASKQPETQPVQPIVDNETKELVFAVSRSRGRVTKHIVGQAAWGIPLDSWATLCGWNFARRNVRVELTRKPPRIATHCKKCWKVSLRDLNKLGLPTTVAVAKPRKVSQLVAGGPDMWKMYLHDQGLDTEVLQETRGEVELSLDWLEVLPDLADAFDCLVECRFDEVFASSSFSGEMLAMRACIGNVMKQTPLTQRKEQEFKVETILRLPVTRSAVETESLELAAVDGRGNVCASLLLRLRHLKSGKLLQSKLRMDGASKLDAQVSLKCSGLGSRVQAERQRWKSKESGAEQTDETQIHLDWVNMVCRLLAAFSVSCLSGTSGRLHPKIITLAARQLEDPFGLFTQSLRLKTPLPLQDIHFSHFLLGTTPPEVGPFEVSEWQHPHDGSMGIEMKVGFNLDTEANIEMQVHGVKLGINRMFLKGDLLIRLEPLIDEIPVIGGIVVCFLNQPEVEFQYSGLAAHVDSNILRSLLHSAVAQALVLPQVVKIPIGTEEQNVDRALLDPAPVGVLRIWALHARDLPSSWPLGSRSRSPFMDLSLETEQWQTSVVYHSTSPEWNEKHDFLVFDKRQEVGIKVCDSNSLFLRNVIAAAPPVPVDDLVFQSEQEVALLNYDHGDDAVSPVHPSSPSSPAGTAVLRFEWLNFVRPGRRGPDSRHLLRVKLDEVVVPTELLDVQKATVLDPTLVKMRAKVREVTKDTPAVAWFPTATSMDEASGASGTVGPTVELDLEHTLFLLINAVDLDAGALELELRNGNDKILGSAQIKISDVLAAGGMKWRGNRRLALKHATGRAAIFSRCIADLPAGIAWLTSKSPYRGLDWPRSALPASEAGSARCWQHILRPLNVAMIRHDSQYFAMHPSRRMTTKEVYVTKIDDKKKSVVVTFAADKKVWKEVPFSKLGRKGCPLQPFPASKAQPRVWDQRGFCHFASLSRTDRW